MTSSGRRSLLMGGHRFSVHQNEGVRVRWRCLLRTLFRGRYWGDATNIYIGGHKFCRHSRSLTGNRIRWTCAKKHKLKCKASAVTIDGVVMSTTGLHSHD
ncbi:unnamed protein product [Colias eurytheme]|nr:unnamed protein product [Colias eurytheme]